MPLSFKEKVFAVVRNIPKGSVLTYKEVAVRAGSHRAFRAVGSAMKTNFDLAIPCHRVVKSSGEVGNYNRGGTPAKRKLLLSEGVPLR
ncbi:MAG: MGMT family protein [bacterium]|nr:MGMT family protein [bacterium]